MPALQSKQVPFVQVKWNQDVCLRHMCEKGRTEKRTSLGQATWMPFRSRSPAEMLRLGLALFNVTNCMK